MSFIQPQQSRPLASMISETVEIPPTINVEVPTATGKGKKIISVNSEVYYLVKKNQVMYDVVYKY